MAFESVNCSTRTDLTLSAVDGISDKHTNLLAFDGRMNGWNECVSECVWWKHWNRKILCRYFLAIHFSCFTMCWMRNKSSFCFVALFFLLKKTLNSVMDKMTLTHAQNGETSVHNEHEINVRLRANYRNENIPKARKMCDFHGFFFSHET